MVYENPDELGYFMFPLGRSAAQEDMRAEFEPERAEDERAAGPWANAPLSARVQRHMAKAACMPEDSALAEQHRNHAGYRWDIDPGGF